MKKFLFSVSLLTAILASTLLQTTALAQAPEGQAYVIQTDDWLSKLADKYLGDPLAYPQIIAASNAKALEDDSFAIISNPDVIEVGQKVWIPDQDQTAQADLVQAEEDVSSDTAEGTSDESANQVADDLSNNISDVPTSDAITSLLASFEGIPKQRARYLFYMARL